MITCVCVIVGVAVKDIIQTNSLEYLVSDVKIWFIASLYGSGTIERVYLSILYEADRCDMVSAGIFCGGYHCTILYGL